ncbi:MAG: hypothetical protein O2822_03270 [Chloroflexi bacterium]|nr:hypothetical protein [Chloroflexota bacterium]
MTVGRCAPVGNWLTAPLMRRSTSAAIVFESAESLNWIVTAEKPCPERLVMMSMSFRPATASSIGRETWISISRGFAPG